MTLYKKILILRKKRNKDFNNYKSNKNNKIWKSVLLHQINKDLQALIKMEEKIIIKGILINSQKIKLRKKKKD